MCDGYFLIPKKQGLGCSSVHSPKAWLMVSLHPGNPRQLPKDSAGAGASDLCWKVPQHSAEVLFTHRLG